MAEEAHYVMAGHETDKERKRLRLMEQVNDPTTQNRLRVLGIGSGWRCAEVGGGGGSIARWMAEQVGDSGEVVATELNTVFLAEGPVNNMVVLQHDITQADLPGEFDLVHCRDVLIHVTDPTIAFARMVRALRPGGWLFIEQKDGGILVAIDTEHPLAEGYGHPLGASARAWSKRIIDFIAGRVDGVRRQEATMSYLMPDWFAEAGLVDVDHQLVGRIARGGDAWSQILDLSLRHSDPMFLAHGILTQEEIEERTRLFNDPTFTYLGYLNVTTWGRRAPV